MSEVYRLTLPQLFESSETQHRRGEQRLEEVIVELYSSMRGPLLSYAYQIAGSSGEAEDLVQIAFLKLYDQLRNRVPIENVRSWLYRVVHNAAIDHLRRQGKQESLIATWLTGQADVSSSAEQDLILRQRIAECLSLLNERERRCLMLRASGLSYKEISDVLSISTKAVSVYLVRGLKKIGGYDVSAA